MRLATRYEGTGTLVLIHVRTVALARKIHDALRKTLADEADKGENRLAILTGMPRGYERDRLTEHPVVQRLSPMRDRAPCGDTAYLVSTAAGEVGANYDADHCVCDLATLENMIQRFGRVTGWGCFPRARRCRPGRGSFEKTREGKADSFKPLAKPEYRTDPFL